MKQRFIALVLAASLFSGGCGTLSAIVGEDPAKAKQAAVDLSGKSIEAMRTALVTALITARELRAAGVIEDEEIEIARFEGKRALAVIKAANAAVLLYLKGASDKATVENQVSAAEAGLEVVRGLVATWRSRPAPDGKVEDDEVRP